MRKSRIKYYPWFYYPNAVHEMLIHSTQVMEVLDLPRVWYSEEPLESNKTRKTPRNVTMLDMMIRLQCNRLKDHVIIFDKELLLVQYNFHSSMLNEI